MDKVCTGKVKMFNARKGYGFIHYENEKDVFFHYSNIIDDNEFKALKANDEVTFELEETDRGLRAKNVKKI